MKTLALIDAELIGWKNLLETWTNKGTDKPYVADSLIHSTTCHTRFFVLNFKILGTVVPEKSLTK